MMSLFFNNTAEQRRVGFTLIELLVVISILIILGAVVITTFKSFQARQVLELSVKEVRQMFELARSQTLASVNDSGYGVHVDSDKAVLFKGTSYSASAPENVSFNLDKRVTISKISFTPEGSDIVFSRGSGDPSASGYIEISLTSDINTKKKITLTSTGILYSNE